MGFVEGYNVPVGFNKFCVHFKFCFIYLFLTTVHCDSIKQMF